jgi:hypothetical protein
LRADSQIDWLGNREPLIHLCGYAQTPEPKTERWQTSVDCAGFEITKTTTDIYVVIGAVTTEISEWKHISAASCSRFALDPHDRDLGRRKIMNFRNGLSYSN